MSIEAGLIDPEQLQAAETAIDQGLAARGAKPETPAADCAGLRDEAAKGRRAAAALTREMNRTERAFREELDSHADKK